MSKPRILEIAADEMWSPYYEEINELLHQEKKARQENDSNKSAEVCVKVVSLFSNEMNYYLLKILASKSIRRKVLPKCDRMAFVIDQEKGLSQIGSGRNGLTVHKQVFASIANPRNRFQHADSRQRSHGR